MEDGKGRMGGREGREMEGIGEGGKGREGEGEKK